MRTLLPLIILLVSAVVYGQNKITSGIIVEEKTSLPLEGATVTVLPFNETTLSDERGGFFSEPTVLTAS